MVGVDLSGGAYTSLSASDVTTTTNAMTALVNVKAAITQLATDRATIGAYQVRMNLTSEQLVVSKEILSAPATIFSFSPARPCWPRLIRCRKASSDSSSS